MFELFVPYMIATALGMTAGADINPGATAATEPAPSDMSASADAPAATDARVPEDQTPTGRFTTAAEIRMILDATKDSWVKVRAYEGQDLLYFTHLASWRCGLWDVSYGLNGEAPETPFVMEPCHDENAAPNTMFDMETFWPYLAFPLDSVQSVTVRITYDDGTTDEVSHDRAFVLIP